MAIRSTLLCLFSALTFLLSLATATDAQANTLYVSTSGNDNNPGSISSPLASPQKAINLAAAGDTVYLRAGTYNATGLRDWKAGMTMASYPGELATLVPNNDLAVWIYRTDSVTIKNIKFVGRTDQTGMGVVVLVTEANNITVADCDISGGWDYAIKWDAYDGDSATPARNSTGGKILRCKLHHTGRDAVKTFNADGFLIEDCEIYSTGIREDNAEGIDSIGSKGITIRRCYIHDTRTTGVYLKGGATNGLIEQCRIVNCGNSGLLFGQDTDLQFMRDGTPYEASNCLGRNNIIINTVGAGIGTYSGSNIRFENNTMIDVAKTYHAGFYVVRNGREVNSRQVLYKNNIVVMRNTDRPMVYIIQLEGALVCDSNIWYRADSGQYKFNRETATAGDYWLSFADWKAGMGVDSRSMTVDPKLDSANLYKPASGSMAIDHGEALSDVLNDYSGTARPQGAAYDIGGQEAAGSAPPPANQPPVVSVKASVTSGQAPLAVIFTGSATDADGQVVGYNWSFGDGQTSSSAWPSHTYQSAGSFTARLTVTDEAGASASASVVISVGSAPANQPPQVRITATPTSGSAPLSVQFNTIASDADGQVVGYSWDFGDGQTSTEAGPAHTYIGQGSFTARLTVTDNGGATASTTIVISVTASPTPGCASVPTATSLYQNSSFAAQTGTFSVAFDVTPGAAGTDGAVALSLDAQREWTKFAVIIRFSETNTIDARNGAGYAAARQMVYTANTTYHLRVAVNVGAHTYSVYVTAPGGAEQLLGENYSFRTEQQGVTSLNNWAAVAEAGSLKVCDFTLLPGGANQPPKVGITASVTSGAAPLAVSFVTNATDVDGQVVGYSWNFGDGQTSTAASPSHTYQTVGSFTASVTVTDNAGATATASVVITVKAAGSSDTPSVRVITPNLREVVNIGSTYKITWETGGATFTRIAVSYTYDDGASWQAIATDLPGTATALYWTAPKVKTRYARVRVTAWTSTGAQVADESDSNFILKKVSTTRR